MSPKYFFVCLTFLVTFQARAQILRVDKSHLASDSSGYLTGAIDLRFLLNNSSATPDQNSTFVGIEGNTDLVYLFPKHAMVAINTLEYFKPGEGRFIYNGSTHLRMIWFRNQKLSPETFMQFQFDETRELNKRNLLGLGFRYNFISGDNSLHAGIGMFNEVEEWQLSEAQIIRAEFRKLNSYFGGEVNLNDKLIFNSIVYFQTAFDNSIDLWRHRISGHLELKDQISKSFLLKFSADLAFDDRPIIPLVRFLYRLEAGIEFQFNVD